MWNSPPYSLQPYLQFQKRKTFAQNSSSRSVGLEYSCTCEKNELLNVSSIEDTENYCSKLWFLPEVFVGSYGALGHNLVSCTTNVHVQHQFDFLCA